MPSETENELREFMAMAIEEAKQSLREGNKGFGSVLVKDGSFVDKSHDTQVTDSDPTAHAEIKLINSEVKRNSSHNLEGYTLITTHEPCPMCAGAAAWARVSKIVYGTSIEESKKLGRTMIDLKCNEVTGRVPWKIEIIGGVLGDRCSRLYDSSVRELVKQYRSGGPSKWKTMGQELAEKRILWFNENREHVLRETSGDSEVEMAYQLILSKIGIDRSEAPIVEESEKRIVFHSQNPCPALDACQILGLDTRLVCRLHTEQATDELIKQINPKLRFSRNYSTLRPSSSYCEEIIELQQ